MSEEEQKNINQYLQTMSKEFEEILQRMQADEQKLEHIHRCWSEFNHAVELSLPWLVEAETLLKEGEIDQCKVRLFMTFIWYYKWLVLHLSFHVYKLAKNS